MSDIASLCRLCMGDQNVSVNVFESLINDKSFAQFLLEAFSIELKNDSDLPNMACTLCIQQLQDVETLRQNISTIQKQFQDLLGVESKITVVEEIIDEQDLIEEEAIIREEKPESGEELISSDEVAQEFACTTCPFTFDSASGLIQHRKEHDPHVRTLFCDTCGRLFSSKANLKLHLITHVPVEQRDNRYACNMCEKSFFWNKHLKQHLKTHERTKSEPCPTCGKQVFDVKRHEKTVHQDRKRVACHLCGLQVVRLGMHIRTIHVEAEMAHECGECGKDFSGKRALERHVKLHTGTKFPCPYCTHQTSIKSNLALHLKSRHPDRYEEYRKQQASEPKFKQ